MIHEAEALLRRARAVGSIGRYQLEGALQSAHVYRRRAYEIAIGLERDPAVRRFLQRRQSALPA